MYGHAVAILPACAVSSCPRPGIIILDDDIFCAIHAMQQPEKL